MKHKLLLNVLLAIVWTALTGVISFNNLLIGFVFGYFIVVVLGPLMGKEPYTGRLFYWVRLILWFFKELFVSSIRVAYDVLVLSKGVEPGVIGIPLDVKTDAEITMLANMISLTPGTISLDVSEDRKTLYIHDMYITGRDVERERQAIKDGVERRVRIALATYRPPEPESDPATDAVVT